MFGLGIGALSIAFVMTKLLSKFYTATYSVIFGLFISIIPSVLDESCVIAFDLKTAVSFVFAILGFFVSFYLSDIKKNNEKLKKILGKKEA